jgi:hypothetical protein
MKKDIPRNPSEMIEAQASVETVQEIMPAGYVDRISRMIYDCVKARQTEDDIVEQLEKNIDIFFDARIIVRTLLAGMRNTEHLRRVLERSADKESIYVVGRVTGGKCCPFCEENVEGRIFKLVPGPCTDDQAEDPVVGPVTLLWPDKRVRPERRWVRADYQHVGGECEFVEFDPLVETLDPESGEVRPLAPEENSEASRMELRRMVDAEKNRLRTELTRETDPDKCQVLRRQLSEVESFPD